ncbi:MAG TPA: hypothetical protein VK640_18095 [Actinomycetes bacterium]|nr:hypothetical protein [Actinomycetes bacterium]
MTVTHTGDLVSALLGVPGVAAAAVEPTDAGPGTLRLQLLPGADEVGVAGAVNRILRSRFGLAVDADRVRVLGEGDDVPQEADTSTASAESTQDIEGPEGPKGPEDADALLDALRRSLADLDGQDLDGADLDGADLDSPDLDSPVRGSPASPAGGWPAPPTDPSIAWAAPPAAAAPRPAGTAPAPVRVPARGTASQAGGRPRLVIERVQLVSAGLSTSVTVVLAHGGRSVQGTAEGTATTGSLHRSVAAATLRAVESVVGEGVRFDVEHVEVARTGPDRTALVVVTMVTERATQRLSGASVVREDVRQSVIRAVLAAVNRRVEPHIPGDAPA